MAYRFYNIAAFVLLLPSIAAAQDAALTPLKPLNLHAQYVFEYAGIVFGKAGLDMVQDEQAFEAVAEVTSSGLARVFVKHDSHSEASGTGKEYAYGNTDYDSRYQTRKKKKHVHLRYKNGGVSEQLVEPPDNRASRPEVAKHLLKDTLDPLRLGLGMRSGLHEALAKGKDSFALRLYDGRRLSEVRFVVKEDALLRLAGKKVPAYHVQLSRRLLEGHTKSELEDAAGGEPPLDVYFSRDGEFIPLVLEAKLMFGSVRARLDKRCDVKDVCLLGINP